MGDPFEVLKLSSSSSRSQIHHAWRLLAKQHHPDVGGDTEKMTLINQALYEALALLDLAQDPSADKIDRGRTDTIHLRSKYDRSRIARQDYSSFTISVLPVEGFELLEIAASTLGSIVDSDCPYLIEFSLELLDDEFDASDWCRCELVPEAGATMVHLVVGSARTGDLDIEKIRDLIVLSINQIESLPGL